MNEIAETKRMTRICQRWSLKNEPIVRGLSAIIQLNRIMLVGVNSQLV